MNWFEYIFVLSLGCSVLQPATEKYSAPLCFQSSFFWFWFYRLSVLKHRSVCVSRARSDLAESEACLLQSAGQRRLRGLAVEKEGCQGLLLSEMEEVLVCAERQLLVLVHQ